MKVDSALFTLGVSVTKHQHAVPKTLPFKGI